MSDSISKGEQRTPPLQENISSGKLPKEKKICSRNYYSLSETMKLRQEYNKPVEENKELEATKEVPMNFLSSSLLAKQKAKLVKPKYTLFANSKQPN